MTWLFDLKALHICIPQGVYKILFDNIHSFIQLISFLFRQFGSILLYVFNNQNYEFPLKISVIKIN